MQPGPAQRWGSTAHDVATTCHGAGIPRELVSLGDHRCLYRELFREGAVPECGCGAGGLAGVPA